MTFEAGFQMVCWTSLVISSLCIFLSCHLVLRMYLNRVYYCLKFSACYLGYSMFTVRNCIKKLDNKLSSEKFYIPPSNSNIY